MATNGISNGTATLQQPLSLPPGVPGKPYIISSQDGEIIYIPLSKSATRLLVTGKETDNAFAVVGSSGSQSDPIGFHFHKHTHDVFLCLQGSINVWADDEARTMEAGDFASVPPNCIHQYQILSHHSSMLGLIVPGGWEEFFRFIGESYDGPLFPTSDQRNPFEVLIPKLKAASEKFDMIPVRDKKSFDPQAWSGKENVLPGELKPYFLKHGTGPAFLAGGSLVRPLITTRESGGKFEIGSIEGSSQHAGQHVFSDERSLKFAETHHAFQVAEGAVEFYVGAGGEKTKLHAGELVYVPKGTQFRYVVKSRYAKIYAFASGKGLVELLMRVGEKYEDLHVPEKAEGVKTEALHGLTGEVGHEVL